MLGFALVGLLSLSASAAKAQDGESGWLSRNEVSVQGTGFFTKDSQGNGLSQRSTDTGGVLVGYRFHFNSWLAADATYGYDRNTQENFTSGGISNVQTNVHQATGALVVTVPRRVFRLNPYVLAGVGALVFDPTGNPGGVIAGASRQAKPAFVYGGGVDYALVRHVSLRIEYRGLVYDRPNFGLAALHSGATTHTAQQTAKEAKALSSVSFSTAWTNAETLDQKQAFQSSLFPIGIFWSKQNAFFEPENRSLMSLVSEMIDTMDGPTAVPELSGRGARI
jgi:opacity protein-like surface antigen